MFFPEYRYLNEDDEYFTQEDQEKMQKLIYYMVGIAFVALVVGGIYFR